MHKAAMKLKSFHELVQKYDYFIFDCDGVIFQTTRTIGNSLKTLDYLQQIGKKVYIYSNNSKRGTLEQLQRFSEVGYTLPKCSCITTPYLTAQYLLKRFPSSSSIYLLGTCPFRRELSSYGISICDPLTECKQASAVVCGFDPDFSYSKLSIASKLIRAGAQFIVADNDAYFKIAGSKFPGAAFIYYPLELMSGTKPVIVCKPATFALEHIIERDQLTRDRRKFLMIGDSLKTDIMFGVNAGIDSMLVMSGITDIIALANSIIKPTYILDTL